MTSSVLILSNAALNVKPFLHIYSYRYKNTAELPPGKFHDIISYGTGSRWTVQRYEIVVIADMPGGKTELVA